MRKIDFLSSFLHRKEKDVEKGNMDVEDGEKKKSRSCCGILIRLPFLLFLYIILFAFWLVGLIFAIIIEIIWCPIKIICPCNIFVLKNNEENRSVPLHLLPRGNSEECVWTCALGA